MAIKILNKADHNLTFKFKEKISITTITLKPLLNELAIDIKDIPPLLLNEAFAFSSNASYQNQNLSLNDIIYR